MMTSSVLITLIVCATILLGVVIITVAVWTNDNTEMIKGELAKRRQLKREQYQLHWGDRPKPHTLETWTDAYDHHRVPD